jgi:hypothetical protein
MKIQGSLGLALVAGLACSVSAQEGATVPGLPTNKLNISSTRLVPVGQRPSGANDAFLQDIYNNGDIATPPVGANYYSFGTNVNPVVDEVSFNRGPGAGPGPGVTGVVRTINAVSFGIATGAIAPTSASVDVDFIYYGTLTPGAVATTPVASNPISTFTVTVNQPVGGWAANTIYIIDVDLTQAPLTPFNTTNEIGAVQLRTVEGGSPSLNFLPGFYGDGNSVGDSLNTFYFDNDLNGIIAQTEAFIATSNPTNGLRLKSSLVLSLDSVVDSGSCCLPDGSCILASATSCARVAGVYGGNDTTCLTATCTQPGACVLPDTSCILASSAQCSSLTGVYKGNNTDCANAVCSGPTTLWNNGPLGTGTTTFGGAAAPAGSQWSECPGVTACNATVAGQSSGVVGTTFFRVADDFTIPAGETWTINNIDTFAYQTGTTTSASPFTGASFNLQIWDGPPGAIATSVVVAGDTFTNVLTGSVWSNLYRIFFNTAATNRPIYRNTLTLSPPAVLGPGTYYIDVQTGHPAGSAHFMPLVSTKGFRGTPGRNALQNVPAGVGTDWVPVEDGSNAIACGTGLERIDLPFIVRGSKTGQGPGCGGTTCYADCDAVGGLTANDFICFITNFNQGGSYADCDHVGGLTANDFICFVQAYNAGCS